MNGVGLLSLLWVASVCWPGRAGCSLGLSVIGPVGLRFKIKNRPWIWTGNLILELVCFLKLFDLSAPLLFLLSKQTKI